MPQAVSITEITRNPSTRSTSEWKASGVQKIVQTRNLGQFQVCLLLTGVKEVLRTVLQDQEKIIYDKVHHGSKVTFSG